MIKKYKRNPTKRTNRTKPVVTSSLPEKKILAAELPSTVKLMQGFFGVPSVTFALNAKASTDSATIKILQENGNIRASMIFQLSPVLREMFQLRAEAGHYGDVCSIDRCYDGSYDKFTKAMERMNYSVCEVMQEISHQRRSLSELSPFWPFSMNDESKTYCAGVEVKANDVSNLANTLHQFKTDLPTIRILFNALCDDALKTMSTPRK